MSFTIAPPRTRTEITEWIEKDNLWSVAQTLGVSRDVLTRIKDGQRIHSTTLEVVERRLRESRQDSTVVQRSTEPARTGPSRRRIVDPHAPRAPYVDPTPDRAPLTSTLADALTRKPPK